MPVYEYECQACKYYTEVMQKINDAPLAKCPSCGKRRLKRLVSAPVFRLKGAGWYETDFKSDKEAKRNLVGAEKEETKPESKPEAKEATPAGKEAAGSKEAPLKEAPVKEAKEAKEPASQASSREGSKKGSRARRPTSASRRAVRSSPRKSGRRGRR
jgi:putative FmdB family regulatory protein